MFEVRVAPPMKELEPLQRQSLHTFVVFEDGRLCAAWGVTGAMAGNACGVWGKMFSPPKARREFAMLTRRWRNWLLSLYTTVAALVECDNMRWVQALGFTPEAGQPNLVVYRRA